MARAVGRALFHWRPCSTGDWGVARAVGPALFRWRLGVWLELSSPVPLETGGVARAVGPALFHWRLGVWLEP